MKKALAILLMLTIGLIPAFAGSNPLRLKSGSLTRLKNCGGTIECVLDFSKTKGNRKPLEEYITKDYGGDMETFNSYRPEMLQWFMERWDDDIENGPKAVGKPGADYRLDIIVKNLQLGSKYGSGGASISGYVEFYQGNETEPFAVVEILKMNGTIMGAPMPGYPGMKQTLNDLAEYLCDLIYHSK